MNESYSLQDAALFLAGASYGDSQDRAACANLLESTPPVNHRHEVMAGVMGEDAPRSSSRSSGKLAIDSECLKFEILLCFIRKPSNLHVVYEANYYGVMGNSDRLWAYWNASRRIIFRGLNRRSQRKSYNWTGFEQMWNMLDIPTPRVVEQPYRKNDQSKLSCI